MTVDVVIPTFMESERLFRAVDSVKRQTHTVQKIFVVDDGSGQEIATQLRARFDSDPQIALLELGHSGVPGLLRREAILASSSEWIAFLDADDYWHEEKLERQLSISRRTGAQALFTNAQCFGDLSSTYFSVDKFKERLTFNDLVRSNYLINSSVLVKRDLLIAADNYACSANVRAVEDYATWLRIASLTKFEGSAEALTFYSVSGGSLSKLGPRGMRAFALTDYLIWNNQNFSLWPPRISPLWRSLKVIFEFTRETLLWPWIASLLRPLRQLFIKDLKA